MEVHKAVACVVRRGSELLVFDHPHPEAGTQLPKGTIEAGEDPRDAVLRELEEESGLGGDYAPTRVGTLRRQAGQGFADDPGEPHVWHLFRIDLDEPRERWVHAATGSEEEEGLLFAYRWVALSAAREALHPAFWPVLPALEG